MDKIISNNAKLQIRNVSKEFITKKNRFQVIEDVSFDVCENEFLVLLGPGQCGKTTLLEMIAGLQDATGGTIIHNGKAVTEPDASRAVVYQTIALFPWLTVFGNVSYGPKRRGEAKDVIEKRAQECIRMVGLEGFEESFPNQLSGGMKQRVGIARAYCNQPDVLLMDEPFGHLDAQTRYLMQEDLEKLWESERKTILFVTNNIEEAIYLADRIILLSNCPTVIEAEYTIDLPRPRDLTDPKFLGIRKTITNKIEEASRKEDELCRDR